jgi:hypothetical protein
MGNRRFREALNDLDSQVSSGIQSVAGIDGLAVSSETPGNWQERQAAE